MTKNGLYTTLDAFLSGGYLEEYCVREEFSVFCFFKTVYVGFTHSGNTNVHEEQAKGVLLTLAEAELLLRLDAKNALDDLSGREECCLVFSDALLKKCRSFTKRFWLKRNLKLIYAIPRKAEPDMDWYPNRISSSAGGALLRSVQQFRGECLKTLKKSHRRIRLFGYISLICVFLFLVFIGTNDLRKQLNGERPFEKFDKNESTDQYVRLEIDALLHLASVHSVGFDGTNNYSRYYLWGNGETKEYGILRFESSSDADAFLSEEDVYAFTEESVLLYGETLPVPSVIAALLEDNETEKEEGDAIVLPGYTITISDGQEIYIPETTISLPQPDLDIFGDDVYTDNSHRAAEFLAELGIDISKGANLGTVFPVVSKTPQTQISDINKWLTSFAIFLLMPPFILFFPTFFFGLKADFMEKTLRDPALVRKIGISMIIGLCPQEAHDQSELAKLLDNREGTDRLLREIIEES